MSAISSVSSEGRRAAMARRQALSAGKSALPPPAERVRTGERTASFPVSVTAATTVAPSAANAAPRGGEKTSTRVAASSSPAPAPTLDPHANCSGSCRAQARARRAQLSSRGRGDQPAAAPSRPPRQGTIQYAPKVTASSTHGGQIVTGSRIGRGSQVTGDEPGAFLPVSGTQYIGASDGPPVRAGGPKVGLSRTMGGRIVSGTQVRSKVRVTGDEFGGKTRITGEADQSIEDDLTPRPDDAAPVSSQFVRQVDPHGHSVFGTNLGRSATTLGSRSRQRSAAIEATESGLPITGSAVGRGVRVTGDEEGACRHVTGSQYLTPARSQAECGGTGGGTAPAAQLRTQRRDPVTGAKVSIAQTWGGQRLTGSNVEHDPRVTGDAAGSCSVITGTPYQGAGTIHGWCDPGAAASAEQRLPRGASSLPITGDVPRHSDAVTGTARGAAREVTGSAYYREDTSDAEVCGDERLVHVDARFSVSSPQRTAQLRARRSAAESNDGRSSAPASPAVTGSFAVGVDRVTGNAEFLFRSRGASDPAAVAAHARLTGEGRAQGARVTGVAWSEHSNVTGTEGPTAAERNPSERAGRQQAFSGTRHFKTLAKHEEARQRVTGLLGWSGKTAAKVTLSGGAQA